MFLVKSKGEKYECEDCGLVVMVSDPCGCESCELVCCGEPMKPVEPEKPSKSSKSKK